jgi:hypothetical protein
VVLGGGKECPIDHHHHHHISSSTSIMIIIIIIIITPHLPCLLPCPQLSESTPTLPLLVLARALVVLGGGKECPIDQAWAGLQSIAAVPHVAKLIKAADPDALVITNPAREQLQELGSVQTF